MTPENYRAAATAACLNYQHAGTAAAAQAARQWLIADCISRVDDPFVVRALHRARLGDVRDAEGAVADDYEPTDIISETRAWQSQPGVQVYARHIVLVREERYYDVDVVFYGVRGRIDRESGVTHVCAPDGESYTVANSNLEMMFPAPSGPVETHRRAGKGTYEAYARAAVLVGERRRQRAAAAVTKDEQ